MTKRLSRGLRRGLAGVVLLGALLPAMPASAADLPRVIACNAAGIVTVVGGTIGPGANQWTITGKGSCLGDNNGTYFADVNAVGTSDSLGTCSDSQDPTMVNFELSVTVTLTSTSDPGNNKILTETWSAPVTTFPTATPFLISDGGLMSDNDFVGGGTILTRLYQNCPPGGNPSGQIAWTRTL